MNSPSFPHRLSRGLAATLVEGVVVLSAFAPVARGTVTVVGETIAEGSNPASPSVVRFTLTNSPAAQSATTWEYSTSSDTAREGADYVGVRGSLTIPANETTAVVDVSLVSDELKESDETFALLVWPQGGAPVPTLTEIPKPAIGFDGQPFRWLWYPVSVSEGNWSVDRLLGESGDGVWNPQRMIEPGNHSFGVSLLAGNWLYRAYRTFDPPPLASSARLLVVPKTNPGGQLWEPSADYALPNVNERSRFALAGAVLAAVHTDGVRFFQLLGSHPPRSMGFIPLNEFGLISFASDGKRIAIGTTGNIRVYDAVGNDCSQWKAVALIPGVADVSALEGDRLLTQRNDANSHAWIDVRERNHGGADAWGVAASLALPDEAGIWMTSLRTGIAYVGGSGGKIHVFVNNPADGTWTRTSEFTAPNPAMGPYFGSVFGIGGRELLALSPEGDVDGAWGGTLPGATARILDDDLPTVSLPVLTVDEPQNGTAQVRAEVGLSHPSAVDVQMTLSTGDSTAHAGEDFAPLLSQVTIPAGSLSAVFAVTINADVRPEPEEALFIFASQVTGAQPVVQPARWRISDHSDTSFIYAPPQQIYEGVGPVPVPVRIHSANGSLAVPWSVTEVGQAFPGPGVLSPALATLGTDVLHQSGVAMETGGQLTEIALAALSDSAEEPGEPVEIAFQVDASIQSGSFSYRMVGLLPGEGSSRPASTDGEWVALSNYERGELGRGLVSFQIYGRDALASGGWSLRHTLDAQGAGIPAATEGYFKLRKGRLVYYAPRASRAWFLAAPTTEGGAWTLEGSTVVPWSSGSEGLEFDFDGDSLVIQKDSNELLVYERGEGNWLPVHVVPFGDVILDYPAGPKISGTRCAAFVRNPDGTHAVQLVERILPGSTPWTLTSLLPLSAANASGGDLRLNGDVLTVSSRTQLVTEVFHRSPSGVWQLKQSLGDVIRFFDRAMLFGSNHVYLRNDTGETPWRMLGPGLQRLEGDLFDTFDTLDLCGNVVVSRQGINQPNQPGRGGFAIAEPGVSLPIADEDTFAYTVETLPSVLDEPIDAEGVLRVVVRARGPVPVDVTIPFRTVTGGTAAPGLDYRPVEGVLLIRTGREEASFLVPALPDRRQEGDETIQVELTAPSYGVVWPTQQVLTIKEGPISVVPPAMPLSAFEPPAGQETVTFPFRLLRPFTSDLMLNYEAFPLTATSSDVVVVSPMNIPAGQSYLPVSLVVKSDALTEDTETVRLLRSSEVRIDDAMGSGVQDDYSVPQGGMLDYSPNRNVLANDPAGTNGIEGVRAPRHGTVQWNHDGTFRFVAPANFIGTDTFGYRPDTGGSVSVPASTTWRWLNPLDGFDPGNTVPGFHAGWAQPAFDDSSWTNGAWLMGYGPLGSPQRHIDTNIGAGFGIRYTAYFRAAFQAPEAPAPGLSITLAYDDAVIIYLNGVEIGRHGKPPLGAFATAPDSYTLRPPTPVEGAEETALQTLRFPAAQVTAGLNVLAISVHNEANSETDLDLMVTDVTSGTPAKPVRVNVTVTDGLQPPVLLDDTFSFSSTTTPLDSMFLVNGSVYLNDGLLSATGAAYDPILEVETAGTPAGPVTFDKDTGNFRIAGPPGFFGTTRFTYRVRDKDGWSNSATVTLNVSPTRAFDMWRQEEFGGGSVNLQSEAAADGDGDGLANLLEFALGKDPARPDPASVLTLDPRGGAWVAEFLTRTGFGSDVFIGLEDSSSLASSGWQRLAWLNDIYPAVETVAPGITWTTAPAPGGLTRYSIALPPSPDPVGFLRLRASRERHAMDP